MVFVLFVFVLCHVPDVVSVLGLFFFVATSVFSYIYLRIINILLPTMSTCSEYTILRNWNVGMK